MKGSFSAITALLCCVAGLAYGGILFEAREARNAVTDWFPVDERLAADVASRTNAMPYPQYGFADLGADFHRPSRVSWSLRAAPLPAEVARTYLFVVADEPLFYAADAAVRVMLSGHVIGVVRARSMTNGGGPFAADLAREELFVPPGRAFGYQFALPDPALGCSATCSVTIDGTLAFWRIYRIGIVRERGRFQSLKSQ